MAVGCLLWGLTAAPGEAGPTGSWGKPNLLLEERSVAVVSGPLPPQT